MTVLLLPLVFLARLRIANMRKLLFLALFFISQQVFAATWYVDRTATSSTNAGTQANPWITLYDSAHGTSSGSVAAGDTINVLPTRGGEVYEEAAQQSSSHYVAGTDISFSSGALTITSTAGNFGSFLPTTWATATAYSVGAVRKPITSNGYCLQVTAKSGTGTSAGSEPTWSTTPGGTTIDNAGANQLTWKNVECAIRVTGSTSNDGQYSMSTITSDGAGGSADVITLKSNNSLTTEDASARVVVTDIIPNQPGSGSVSFAFDTARNGSAGSPITWNFNRNIISAGVAINGRYKWNLSSGGTGEWYVTRADGSNPSFIKAESAVVNNRLMVASASDTNHKRGTVGSLAYPEQYGWGNNDSLTFETVYVKTGSPNKSPSAMGWQVSVGQLAYGLWQGWTNQTINDAVWMFGNGMTDQVTFGANVTGRGSNMIFDNNDFLAADGQGFDANNQGPFTITNSRLVWTGHRGMYITGSAVTLNAYNNVDWGNHVCLLMGSAGDGKTSTANYYNNICANSEAGAIDKKSATMTLNEGCNLFDPSFIDTNGDLANGSSANWATTAATDLPASTATTTRTGINNKPGFVKIPGDSISFNVTDFKLKKGSVARRAGCNKGVELDSADRKYHLSNPSMGVYEVTSGHEATERTAR